MKKMKGKGADLQLQLHAVSGLIEYIPCPVLVTKPDGTALLQNTLWNKESASLKEGITEIPILGSEEEHLMSIWIDTSGAMVKEDIHRWKESAEELQSGLLKLVAGYRVPLPPPDPNDPLAEVKKEFNAALVTVEKLISVSKLF